MGPRSPPDARARATHQPSTTAHDAPKRRPMPSYPGSLTAALTALLALWAAWVQPAAALANTGASLGPGRGGGGGGPGAGAGALQRRRSAAGSCVAPKPLSQVLLNRWGCQQYRWMCVDQQQFITYDPKYNPRLSRDKPLKFDVKEMVYNWPNPWGNGDKFEAGRDIRIPHVVIRANTSEECCEDLQRPAFSACTSPIVVWQRWLYNVGEVFETSYNHMHAAFREGLYDPAHTLVVATPHGLRLPGFAGVFFESVFNYKVTSLAEFSERPRGEPEPSGATAEGVRHRCFEVVTLCKFRNRKDDGTSAAGEHLLQHYADRLPPVGAAFGAKGADQDRSGLRVVIASRPNATGRAILNEEELLEACNGLDLKDATVKEALRGGPGGGLASVSRLVCIAHVFGRDIFYDMALAKATDVLVATHGAAGYHSFMMPRGSSLVEVLPLRFNHQWAEGYYAKMLELDKKVFYWSIWIHDPANSAASAFESSDVFRHEFTHREHHVRLPWSALRQHLLGILRVGGDPASYKAAYVSGDHAINDSGQPVEHRPKVGRNGWEHFRPGQGDGGGAEEDEDEGTGGDGE
ncbi:hypothetical protein HYH03_012548 [Edaphochlamys debaryana]|uniref:Glycosyltransferase n=1 Tax=Edaphochlamys debaryana TaxID=47281 RepID=A0A835XRU0_9CHLO|nr:hypothetical protein HYH03_012548 [Edaphochlamys debaryana]|eukprot:KAG2488926.1 hypothetical protein HYH03_012548 [Edaphochlamys debaryana]